MSQDYGPAIWLGNDQIGYGGWGFFTPKWIICHGTAGDATIEGVQRTFISNKQRGDPSSTHFAVGQDGRVGQYVPESEAAWGNGPITGPAGHAIAGTGNAHDSWWDGKGNANPYSYSIEHCKPDQHNDSALTPAQKAASFALIKHLCDAHGIPKRVYGTATPPDASGGITGHFSMDPLNRAFCPGTFPWQELQDYLDGGSSGPTPTTGEGDKTVAGIPAGWKDDGTTLTAPNGKTVTLGFRDHILGNPWYAGDVPLDADHGEAGGDAQTFRYTVLHFHAADGSITESDRLDDVQAQARQQVAQAQRDRDTAQQALSQAQTDYQREQALYATIATDDKTTHAALDKAQGDLAQAQADRDAARVQVENLQQQLDALKQQQGSTGTVSGLNPALKLALSATLTAVQSLLKLIASL